MKSLNYILALSILFLVGCAKPISKFTFSEEVRIAPISINFENQSQKAETYEWDFGDGNTSTDESPSHRYTGSGNYLVRLRAIKEGKVTTSEKRVVVDAPEICLVELETEMGTMTIKLFDSTPKHRDNFIKLVEEGFYDGLLFHRVVNGFMIQGGDPNSKNAGPKKRLGSGGPGYRIPAEFVDTLAHVKGALAAARTGGPSNPEKESSGSQFYIVQGRKIPSKQLKIYEAQKDIRYTESQIDIYTNQGGTPQLDQGYTVFGQVVKGLDVIDKIAATETDGDPPKGASRPKTDVTMKMKVIK